VNRSTRTILDASDHDPDLTTVDLLDRVFQNLLENPIETTELTRSREE